MAEIIMTWVEFVKESREFLQIAQRLGDNWTLIEKNQIAPNIYLKYEQKIHVNDATSDAEPQDFDVHNSIFQVEYHVVYSISYQIPMLYVQIHGADGRLLDLESAWKIFHSTINCPHDTDIRSILTQMEHPILYRPYLALHPCKTAKVLGQFSSAESTNRVLTFISLYGPYVRLNLQNEYGLLEHKTN